MSESIDLLDLETRLRTDEDGSARRGLEEQLLAWRQSLKAELDAGVTKQRFQPLNAIIDAVDAAAEVVNARWQRHHKAG